MVADPDRNKAVHDKFSNFRSEYVVAIKGTVTKRPQGSINSDEPMGAFEIYPDDAELLNTCRVLPFQLDQANQVDEAIRLKYRYLDSTHFIIRNKTNLLANDDRQ